MPVCVCTSVTVWTHVIAHGLGGLKWAPPHACACVCACIKWCRQLQFWCAGKHPKRRMEERYVHDFVHDTSDGVWLDSRHQPASATLSLDRVVNMWACKVAFSLNWFQLVGTAIATSPWSYGQC